MRVELSVKYFDHDDLESMNDWLRARNKPPQEMSDLPAIGFVVAEGDTRVATCFLRRCEGNYGIVDGLCTNPAVDSAIRHVAIDTAVRMVCEEARQREISHLVAWTVEGSVLARGMSRHGFQKSSFSLLTKDLTKANKLDS